jgi:glucose-1-phosphate thymidylyltransferase
MKAIIPVAGEGTRLRPHTYTVPKVLISVAGKPLLGHILDRLTACGVDEVVLVIGHLGEQIVDYVRDTYDCEVRFASQTDRLGLGHAIHLTREHMGSEPCMIVLGDTIFDADLTKVVGSPSNCVGVKRVDDPRRFGVVTCEGTRVTQFVEKADPPISDLALVGVNYIADTEALFDSLEQLIRTDTKTKGEFQLTDALQIMLERGSDMRLFYVDGWFDCGKPETLLATNRSLLRRASHQKPRDGNILVPPVFVAESAKVSHSVIGPDVTIDEEAEIESAILMNSIVGRKAHVTNIVLEGSIIGPNASVSGRFCRLNVGDSSQIDFGPAGSCEPGA